MVANRFFIDLSLTLFEHPLVVSIRINLAWFLTFAIVNQRYLSMFRQLRIHCK
jgi:hypothetical protein